MQIRSAFLGLLLLAAAGTVSAQKKLTIHAGKPAAAISSQMWGIFFEDINFGADGGLYAELVKNGSFEFPMPLMGWREMDERSAGKVLVVNRRAENERNARYAHVTVKDTGAVFGISNEGFRGIGYRQNAAYDFSLQARALEGKITIRVEAINYSGKLLASARIPVEGTGWKEYRLSLTAADTAQRGKLNVFFEGSGAIDIDRVSLFPKDTWKGRTGGLRNDLVQWLADLKPGFVRFPGGCIVEGRDLTNRYQWKNTVGPVQDRLLQINRWNQEFAHRAAPDYFQSYGLGFYEYFLLAEDIGAEPLPILNCGMACQFNSSEVTAMNELEPFVQDALDLIEFANGPVTSEWGKLRASMGHPAPFGLKLMGVGNEQWDEQYIERYKVFEKAIHARYPAIKLVSGAGPFAGGALFEYAWKQLRALQADLIDEHYYLNPRWFFDNAKRYDNYDRQGPKVFAGEYASHVGSDPAPESMNSWLAALSEAAFMTGLERNADVVRMCSYAPLFSHIDAWQWRPDLIWFDNLRSMATPNYYVQKLFANNRGTVTVPVLDNGAVLAGKDSLYASGVIDSSGRELIIKLVNSSSAAGAVELNIEGIKALKKQGSIEELYSPELTTFNSLNHPDRVHPVTSVLPVKGRKISLDLKPRSLTVVHLPF